MKTEPTELNKKEPVLAVNHMVDWTDEGKSITTDICYKWLKIAFSEGQSNPKIKQLEWEDDVLFADDILFADIIVSGVYPLLVYRINIIDSTLHIGDMSQSFNTIEEAKAFAQNDFEARIKECLITE